MLISIAYFFPYSPVVSPLYEGIGPAITVGRLCSDHSLDWIDIMCFSKS